MQGKSLAQSLTHSSWVWGSGQDYRDCVPHGSETSHLLTRYMKKHKPWGRFIGLSPWGTASHSVSNRAAKDQPFPFPGSIVEGQPPSACREVFS